MKPKMNVRDDSIDPEILLGLKEHIRKERKRMQEYGRVRPIIHAKYEGYDFVAVGSRLYYGKNWNTFHDFLFDYIRQVLGVAWGKQELQKSLEERHQILKWYDGICRFQKSHESSKNSDGICSAVPNGVAAAFLNLAYDLYVLNDNLVLWDRILARLKNADQFQGARYELFVAATCIRAGFSIQHEDESDGSQKHTEFVGVHKKTGQHIAVEAKSKRREGVLGQPGDRRPDAKVRTRIGQLLNEAYAKNPVHPYVVFVDVNFPPVDGGVFEKKWARDIANSIAMTHRRGGGKDSANLVIFTNHPHHYGSESEPDPDKDVLVYVSEVPMVPVEHPEVISDLCQATLQYGRVPHEFPVR